MKKLFLRLFKHIENGTLSIQFIEWESSTIAWFTCGGHKIAAFFDCGEFDYIDKIIFANDTGRMDFEQIQSSCGTELDEIDIGRFFNSALLERPDEGLKKTN